MHDKLDCTVGEIGCPYWHHLQVRSFRFFTSQSLSAFACRHTKVSEVSMFLECRLLRVSEVSMFLDCRLTVSLPDLLQQKTHQIGWALWLDELVNWAFWLASENLKGWALMRSSCKAPWCQHVHSITPTILLLFSCCKKFSHKWLSFLLQDVYTFSLHKKLNVCFWFIPESCLLLAWYHSWWERLTIGLYLQLYGTIRN